MARVINAAGQQLSFVDFPFTLSCHEQFNRNGQNMRISLKLTTLPVFQDVRHYFIAHHTQTIKIPPVYSVPLLRSNRTPK